MRLAIDNELGPPLSGEGIMNHRSLGVVGALLGFLLVAQDARGADAQTERGRYARIAILRPIHGHTMDFEAGYIRHLDWHKRARDPWVWYGWSVTFSERQRWFIYATFGHSGAALDNAVAPAEDEQDNILNVAPHVEYLGNAVYEYLPDLSRGTGEPQPSARLEVTTVDLLPGGQRLSRRPSGRAKQNCRGRRSGIGWWRGEPCRAMCGSVRGPAYRPFSARGVSSRFPTGSRA